MPFPAIEDLLLHRGNMLLLDRIIAFSDDTVACLSIPAADAWYATPETGDMPAWIGIELMAQAIAAHAALMARREGKPPRPGALLGTRAFQSKRASYAPAATLVVEARLTFRDATGLGSYDCEILTEQRWQLATAALTVYEPEDFEQFISRAQD